MYSDSQSSQQSVVLGSLADAAPPPVQCVCSPPVSVSVSDGPVLPYSLPSLGTYQQPAAVSWPAPRAPRPPGPASHRPHIPQALWAAAACGQAPEKAVLGGHCRLQQVGDQERRAQGRAGPQSCDRASRVSSCGRAGAAEERSGVSTPGGVQCLLAALHPTARGH